MHDLWPLTHGGGDPTPEVLGDVWDLCHPAKGLLPLSQSTCVAESRKQREPKDVEASHPGPLRMVRRPAPTTGDPRRVCWKGNDKC